MNKWVAFLIILFLSVSAFAVRHTSHRRFHFPSRGPAVIFKAAPGVQQAQNAEIDRLGLPRIANERQLSLLVEREELVEVTPTYTLAVARQIPANRRYLRPWAYAFTLDLSRDFYAEFGIPLQVNSAVRPVTVQQRLRRINSNAAPVTGQSASAHLAGVAVDLQRRGYTTRQVRWLQMRLLLARSRGDVIVIEEVKHPCFHVMVMGGYPNPQPVKFEETPGVPDFLAPLPDPP